MREADPVDSQTAERNLGALLAANQPENRTAWAFRAKEDGRKVIGLLCTYVPEELVLAAGMHPWRITGTWGQRIVRAVEWRDLDMCTFCTHVLESMLDGEFDFLDGVIASDWDDDRRRLFDVWRLAGAQSFVEIISIPKKTHERTVEYFARVVDKLADRLAEVGGKRITEEGLHEAMETVNETRHLIGQVYEMRKRDVPPLTGAEFLSLTTAATVMDRKEFNQQLRTLMPHIENRRVTVETEGPRIMVSSDMLDNPAYLELVEEQGCTVAMDDLDTGSRSVFQLSDTDGQDPVMALARRYCLRPPDPPALDWDLQLKWIMDWVSEYRIDGVIELADDFSPPRRWRWPFLSRTLEEAEIPVVRIPAGYGFGSTGPLSTRIGAFVEMVSDQLM
jgi:benzoyl-CoA reductase/2-hydroxyglutaryl-CoA dehydratase subunit BcrC/BadD/HgdB